MKSPFLAAVSIALPLVFAACDRTGVTSVETPPDSGQPAAPAAPPSAEGGQPGTAAPKPPAAISANETAQFEAWFAKYGLDPKDTAALDADSDGDGYTNREEFLADTNPRDPNSMPGMIDGIAMKELKDVRVPMVLREVKSDKARVERTDSGEQEELVQGSQPKGLPYRVTGIKHEVKADKHGVFTDVSQVTLENVQSKETVVLVRDLPARTSETHAILTGPGGVEQTVRVDETITLPGQEGKQFKVLELRPDQVVVEEIGTRRPLTIPKR
jgi:hypothetical protein